MDYYNSNYRYILFWAMIKNAIVEIGELLSFLPQGTFPMAIGVGFKIVRHRLSRREALAAILSSCIMLYACGNTILKLPQDAQAIAFIMLGFFSTGLLDFILDNSQDILLGLVKNKMKHIGVEINVKKIEDTDAKSDEQDNRQDN